MYGIRSIKDPIDIYKIQNIRKRTYKKVGAMVYDIYLLEVNKQIKDTLNLNFLHNKYNIDHRTLKRYLSDYLYKIGKERILVFNNEDINYISETIHQVKRFKEVNKKHKKAIKYLTYFLLGQK